MNSNMLVEIFVMSTIFAQYSLCDIHCNIYINYSSINNIISSSFPGLYNFFTDSLTLDVFGSLLRVFLPENYRSFSQVFFSTSEGSDIQIKKNQNKTLEYMIKYCIFESIYIFPQLSYFIAFIHADLDLSLLTLSCVRSRSTQIT